MPSLIPSRVIGGRRVSIVPILAVSVMAIFVYGAILRRLKKPDLLERKLTQHPGCSGFDGWGVLHMFYFAAMGWLFPDRYLTFLAVGVAWELIEDFLGQHKVKVSGSRVQIVGDQDEEGRPTGNDDAWWYGRASDVMWNSVGYMVGSFFGHRAACSVANKPSPTPLGKSEDVGPAAKKEVPSPSRFKPVQKALEAMALGDTVSVE